MQKATWAHFSLRVQQASLPYCGVGPHTYSLSVYCVGITIPVAGHILNVTLIQAITQHALMSLKNDTVNCHCVGRSIITNLILNLEVLFFSPSAVDRACVYKRLI